MKLAPLLIRKVSRTIKPEKLAPITPKEFRQAKPGEIYYFSKDGNFIVGQRIGKEYIFIAECRTAEIARVLIRAMRRQP
jgi:hypothetical protein